MARRALPFLHCSFLILWAFALFQPISAQAQSTPYRLAPGDVLQLTVIGFPDLKQRSPVNVDGDVMLPLVGGVKAAGQTVAEFSASVKGRFANKVLQQRSSDGRGASVVLAPDEVNIDILEYRPVYLRGDISKPGEQPFRPGMTVRQAVAVAGGYDILRFRSGNPVQEAAKLRGEAMAAWADLLLQQAAVWRMRNETTGQQTSPDKAMFDKAPFDKATVDAAFKRQADQMATRLAEQQREEAYLKSVIAQSDTRIKLLSEQQRNEEEGSKQDIDDFERVSKLFEKGNTSITRFSDSRRSMLLSATRILQTSAAIAQVEREREEFKKLLSGVDDKRRLEAFREMQGAELKLEEAKAKLSSTQELLLYSSKMRAQLNINGASNAEIVIIRQIDKRQERIVAQEDTELSPGDALEIALDASQMLSFLPN